jgi:hypothetical protein
VLFLRIDHSFEYLTINGHFTCAMDALDGVKLSPLQSELIEGRIEGKTYRQLQEEGSMKLHPDLIRTCFLRAAKGLMWELGQSAGPDPYLCEVDEEDLLGQSAQNLLIP